MFIVFSVFMFYFNFQLGIIEGTIIDELNIAAGTNSFYLLIVAGILPVIIIILACLKKILKHDIKSGE